MSPTEQTTTAEQLGELRADVRHIQSDITEIKADVRASAQRMDALRVELSAKIGSVESKLDAKIDTLESKLDSKIDTLHKELGGQIDKLMESISSAKVWAVLLYVAMGGTLLFVMARGFKWI